MILLILVIVQQHSADGIELTQEENSSDIEEILLDLNPNLILNTDTPENMLIGTVQVLTISKKSYKTLQINKDNPYFTLIGDKLFLKDSGGKLFKNININSVTFFISAIDFNEPPGVFKVTENLALNLYFLLNF